MKAPGLRRLLEAKNVTVVTPSRLRNSEIRARRPVLRDSGYPAGCGCQQWFRRALTPRTYLPRELRVASEEGRRETDKGNRGFVASPVAKFRLRIRPAGEERKVKSRTDCLAKVEAGAMTHQFADLARPRYFLGHDVVVQVCLVRKRP
jgi:hypothetical protein